MFALLPLLTAVPSLFKAGSEIVSAVTGSPPPPEATRSPEALAAHIESLPPDQQAAIQTRMFEHLEALDRNSTERFKAMTAVEATGDVEAIRATARPEIARRAMAVIETFSSMVWWLALALCVEWAAQAAFWGFGKEFPAALSIAGMLSQLAPIKEAIWAPLIASFWVSADVVKTYMGCRERDKARDAEIRAGKPLESTAATIEAAGGGIASIIRAFRKGG